MFSTFTSFLGKSPTTPTIVRDDQDENDGPATAGMTQEGDDGKEKGGHGKKKIKKEKPINEVGISLKRSFFPMF
jgi:hypothetical protein